MIFKAEVSELDTVLAWVEGALDEADVSMRVVMPFLVAVEEIFVNVAHYAYKGSEGDVDIQLSISDKVEISFTDTGVAFDPLAKEDPDVSKSAEDREIGGLGIFMVKKSMDGIEYTRDGDKNILKFWKVL